MQNVMVTATQTWEQAVFDLMAEERRIEIWKKFADQAVGSLKLFEHCEVLEFEILFELLCYLVTLVFYSWMVKFQNGHVGWQNLLDCDCDLLEKETDGYPFLLDQKSALGSSCVWAEMLKREECGAFEVENSFFWET